MQNHLCFNAKVLPILVQHSAKKYRSTFSVLQPLLKAKLDIVPSSPSLGRYGQSSKQPFSTFLFKRMLSSALACSNGSRENVQNNSKFFTAARSYKTNNIKDKPRKSDLLRLPTVFKFHDPNFSVGWSIVAAVALGFVMLFVKYRFSEGHSALADTREELDRLSGQKDNEGKLGEGFRQRKLSLQEAVSEARDLCQRVKDENGCPGLVVAVSVDGRPVWAEGLGYADVENRLPCKADTKMRIASISKSITMAAVARAMEAGVLDIDKPVQDYVPQFPEKYVKGEKVTVTTRHLLSHLGGIRHYDKDYITKDAGGKSQSGENTSGSPVPMTVPNELSCEEYYIKDTYDTTEGALSLFKDDPLVHKPGKYLYTTHGWTLIQAVLEGATKRKFPDIAQSLFYDFGLNSTCLDDNQPLIYNRARFYVHNQKGVLVNAPYVDCSYKYAGGGMLSTAPDLVQFGNAMLYCYQYDNSQSNDSVQQGEKKSNKEVGEMQRKENMSTGLKSLQGQTDLDASCSQGNYLPGYLKPSTMRQIWAPVFATNPDGTKKGYYAMGWMVMPESQITGFGQKERFYVSHTGAAIGASSVLLMLPPSPDVKISGVTSAKVKVNEASPRGVTVAIIVNMVQVSLKDTALDVAKVFERITLE